MLSVAGGGEEIVDEIDEEEDGLEEHEQDGREFEERRTEERRETKGVWGACDVCECGEEEEGGGDAVLWRIGFDAAQGLDGHLCADAVAHQPDLRRGAVEARFTRPCVELLAEFSDKVDLDVDLLVERQCLRLKRERERVADVAHGEEAVRRRDEGLQFAEEGRVVFHESGVTWERVSVSRSVLRSVSVPGKKTTTALGRVPSLGGYHWHSA